MDNPESLNASIRLLNNTLNEILTWTRVTSYPIVRDVIIGEFDNQNDSRELKDLKRKVYVLTDGKNSSRDIEKSVGSKIKFGTIASYQRKWRRQGLATPVDPANSQSKTKGVFDLDDFDLS